MLHNYELSVIYVTSLPGWMKSILTLPQRRSEQLFLSR